MARPHSQYVFDDYDIQDNLDEHIEGYDHDTYGETPVTASRRISPTTRMALGPLQLTPHEDETPSYNAATQSLLDQADAAMASLMYLSRDINNWKPVLTHKNGGAVVYRTAKHARGQIPVFKGVAILHGFGPEAIFALVRNRQLWDDWYLEGHIVEHINESTSLSYMVMKPQNVLSQAVASQRDLALIDRKDFDPATGAIAYASTSVETTKVPKHPGRVRALLKLNGWLLEPHIASDGVTISTKVSYYIQTDVGGLLPNSVVKRYLARRALVVVGVEQYLRKNGPPAVPDSEAVAVRRARTMSILSTSSDGENTPYQFPPPPERSSSFQVARPMRGGAGPEQAPSRMSYQAHNLTEGRRMPSHVAPSYDRQSRQHGNPPPPRSVVNTVEEPVQDDDEVIVYDEHEVPEETDDYEEVDVELEEEDEEEVAEMTSPAPVEIDDGGPSTNPHSEAAQLSLRLLQSLEPEDAGWEFHSQTSGVRISQRAVAGAQMPMVRGDAIIQGPWTAQEIVSVVKSATARRSWDARFEDGRALVNYNLDEALTYSQQKGTFPVSGRDFVTTNMIHFDPKTGAVYYTATSVVDQSAPTDPKRVRAHLTVAGWILKPVSGGVSVSYIVQVDVKGSIPSSIIKVIQTQTPLCIAEVFKYIEHKGFIPFIIRRVPGVDPGRGLGLHSESFEAKGSIYSLEYRRTAAHGKALAVALPRAAYSDGADVQVTPADGSVKVYRVPDDAMGRLKDAASEDNSIVLNVIVEKEADLDVKFRVSPSNRGYMCNGKAIETAPAKPAMAAHPKPAVEPSPVKEADISRAPATKSPSEVNTKSVPSTKTEGPPSSSSNTPPPAARPTYIPHRHTESGVKALKYLKQLMQDEAAWKLHSEQQGVKISTIEDGRSPMPVVRGDSVFPPEFTVDDIVNVLRSSGARKLWDARFEDGDTVEWLNPNEQVFRSLQKGQFPVSGRDICGLQVTVFDARSSTTYIVATSVNDPLVPVDPKRVRADLKVAGWILQPVSNGGGVSITYIVNVDPKGSIPSAIVKAVSAQTPLCVAEVLKYLRTYGSPVAGKVLGNTGEGIKIVVTKERFDHKTTSLEFEYTANATQDGDGTPGTGLAGLVEFQIDPKMYPSGVDLEIPAKIVQDYLMVKSSPDGRFLRLYMRFDAVKEKGSVNIQVKIIKKKKGTGSKDFSVNGVPGSVLNDKSNKVMIPVRKATTAPGASKPTTTTAAARPPRQALNSEPLPTPEAVPKVPVKRRPPPATENAVQAQPNTVPAPAMSTRSLTRTTENRRSTYLLALLSMALRLLRPFLAPNGPDLPDSVDPLDIRALVADAEPLRLVGVSGVALLFFGLLLRWILGAVFGVVGGVFGMFSMGQWILLLALGVGAFWMGKGRR
ncbi:hypothetical protein SpCBS45565_g02823 [Spizellomyces sp. 'palustris']|nr:hypothetical protein SpCBS45565_g02823 [Spizellomyces sp. 'palustris']